MRQPPKTTEDDRQQRRECLASEFEEIKSIRAIARRRGVEQIPKCDLVIIDEAHKIFDLYGAWMAAECWQTVPFIGLSATPWTRGLGKLFDDLLIATTTAELIEKGFLSPFQVYAPNHPDLSGVKTVAGDYHEGQLSEVMSETTLTADIVMTWKQRAEGRPTLAFAVDRAHAKKIQIQFESEGIRCGYCDAFTPKQERARLSRWFHSGEVKVVVSIGTLTTGIDWDVRCIILARPTKSEMLFVQIIGRGLRTAEGKDSCLILDHSDTHLRLGFVTDIHHTALDNGKHRAADKRDRKIVQPKECPACKVLKPAKTLICPRCGFKPEAQSQIQIEEGDLVAFDKKRQDSGRQTRQSWYSMLLHIADERGYKKGWAANQYRQKFEVWPRGLAEMSAPPTSEVLSYVKASMIRYASRRRAA